MYRDRSRPPALSQSMTISRRFEALETPPRPSTARSSRSSERLELSRYKTSSPRRPRRIHSPSRGSSGLERMERERGVESPEDWFKRVMRLKKLSPLDLADIFAFGDAGKHGKVLLSHICEVMFELDPESRGGADPVSESMEEFLYEHSYEDDGEIVVDIKAALRSLDIWHLDVAPATSASSASSGRPKSALDPRARLVMLESKNKQLVGVGSSVRNENTRRSLELEASRASRTCPEGLSPSKKTEFRPDKSQYGSKSRLSSASPSKKTTAIPTHEDDLAAIANTLTYSGVKKLEEQLALLDTSSTGFIGLKQLRWLLLDRFNVDTTEIHLLEMCLGMNFNPQAQLDCKELVTALLDILIYSSPSLPASKKSDVLSRFDKYLASGFPPHRHTIRQLLEQLCRKYDLESDGRIALAELLRVLRRDLVEEHALRLAFPLTEKETIQLILSASSPLLESSDYDTGPFVYYDQVLDELFGRLRGDEEEDPENPGGRVDQALSLKFWERIRKTLCNGSRAKEATVLDQIVKIVQKLDRSRTFTVSRLFFKRIFDQHLCPEDLYVLSRALLVSKSSGKDPEDRNALRYDIFLYLTFGAPRIELDVGSNLPTTVTLRSKLVSNEKSLRLSIADVMKTHGAGYRLDIQSFCQLVKQSTERDPLDVVELLLLFSTLSEPDESVACVQVKKLWIFLTTECWDSSSLDSVSRPRRVQETSPSLGFTMRELIVECLSNYDLERVLAPYKQQDKGYVATTKLTAELVQMFHSMGVAGRFKTDKDMLRDLEAFVLTLTKSNTSRRQEVLPFPGGISLDDFFDAVFDWDALVLAMRLPQNLLDVNRQLQVFDWDRNGTIQCDDWNKVWRLVCLDRQGMLDWEIRVLQRRFPGSRASSTSLKTSTSSRASSLSSECINYSRLLVFLLDLQQQQARNGLQRLTVDAIQAASMTDKGEMSTFRMQKLFQALDPDDKGFFNALDLVNYLSRSLEHQRPGLVTASSDDNAMEWLSNADAVAFVMQFLSSGVNPQIQKIKNSTSKPLVVTFDQFRRFVSDLAASDRGRQALKASATSSSSPQATRTVVNSLRSLELTILDISRDVSQSNGHVLPLQVFKYFSQGTHESHTQSQSPSKSPLRRAELSSPIKNRHRELQAAKLDPLTPDRLKQVLHRRHHLTVSTHLLGQFFLHIGAKSKLFLELNEFSKWVSPLSADTIAKVREVVKKMIAKGKGGGGKVDLDRFLAQLERRLQDSPQYYGSVTSSGSMELPSRVPVSLLLSKLHNLNIPLSRSDTTALLRHFGVEDDDGYVDYTIFLQRLYETSLTT